MYFTCDSAKWDAPVATEGLPQYGPHQEMIVVFHIADQNPQKIVPVPGHRVAFDDFVAGCDKAVERVRRLDEIVIDLDMTDHVDAATEPRGIDEADLPPKHAIGFQRAHSPPA